MKKQVNVRPTIVVQGGRRARSPAIIDTASNHGDSLLSRFENEWKRSRKKLQLSICLQSGAPYTTFTWYQRHFSSSCIVLIIFVFLPSLSLSKVFLVSIITIFRAALTQLCILAPLACWLVLSAADLIAYLIKIFNNQISAK